MVGRTRCGQDYAWRQRAAAASKARLAEAARTVAGGTEVSDRMGLARGAPPRFDAAALLLVDQIGKLKDGKITLSDAGVTLTGMAREIGSREAIAAALKNLPEGFSVKENAIKAPPYIFQATKDPVANTVTLAGYVPDNAVHGRRRGGRPEVLLRKAGGQSQGQRRRAAGICQRGDRGARRTVAGLDGIARDLRPRGETVG